MSSELYSYELYRGYDLFVECLDYDEHYTRYAGTARLNGTTMFTSISNISGDIAEQKLKGQIDES